MDPEGIIEDEIVTEEPEEVEAGIDALETEPEAEAVESDEDVITLAGEPAVEEDPTKARQWVRDLRKTTRETVRRLREVEAENARLKQGVAPVAQTLGPKPKLEDCGYDEDKFGQAVDGWYARKNQADAQQRQQQEQQEALNRQWQAKQAAYQTGKASLKVRDFDEAESAVDDAFSQVQNGILTAAADNAAALKYAIGKSPSTLKRLAGIIDPIVFAVQLGKVESQLKVTKTKTAPIPERKISGSGPLPTATKGLRERLLAESEKSGDMTKLVAFDRDQRRKTA